MCQACGCSEPGRFSIDGEPVETAEPVHEHPDHPQHHPTSPPNAEGSSHSHHHHHHSHHPHPPDRSQTEGSISCAEHGPYSREIHIQRDILSKNDEIAEHNRQHLVGRGILCTNWISAPGAGKTSLLERLITDYSSEWGISVIEGDQQTDADATRIRKAGADAVQINTGAACHLDAEMIHQALHRMNLDKTRLLVIENVGNMVCPTAYDLGETLKIAVISCPEGDDKPLKYPDLLMASQVLLINKIDLIPYLNFDLSRCQQQARRINPGIQIFPVSAESGEGLDRFFHWLIGCRSWS